MWWHSTCIVGRVPRCLPMKTRSETPTAGVLMPPLDKKLGRLSRNGSLPCAWNWGMCLSRRRCARFLVCSRRQRTHSGAGACAGLCQAFDRFALESGAFLGAGLRPPARRGAILSGGQNVAPNRAAKFRRWESAHPRASPGSSIVAAARCASSVSGTGKPPRSRVGEVACSIRSGLVAPRCVFRDWSRREHRRACIQLLRHQRIEVSLPPPAAASSCHSEVILSRAQRAHARLSWAERFARNARVPTASQVTIRLFGVPEGFASSLGLATA
jgi:hypothetical protein